MIITVVKKSNQIAFIFNIICIINICASVIRKHIRNVKPYPTI